MNWDFFGFELWSLSLFTVRIKNLASYINFTVGRLKSSKADQDILMEYE